MGSKTDAASIPSPRMSHDALEKLLIKGVILFFAAILVYIPAMDGGYIYDDDQLLYLNPIIQRGTGFNDKESWLGLASFWLPLDVHGAADYFPATSSMLWLEWRLFGNNDVDAPPSARGGIGAPGYHIVNIVLHALCVLLVWAVLENIAIPGAWISALIWGVHPVCVESVAWISELKNTLSMFLFMLMMLAWFKYQRTRRAGDYSLTIVLFIIALLAKTAIIMAPFVLLLYIWWDRGTSMRFEKRQLACFSGILLLFAVWCATGYESFSRWYYHGFSKTSAICIFVMVAPILGIPARSLFTRLTDIRLRETLSVFAILLTFALWVISGLGLCSYLEWKGLNLFVFLVTPVLAAAVIWIYRKLTIEDLIESIPFFAISFVFGVITLYFQVTRAIGQETVPIGNVFERIAGASFALGFYLYKIVFPVNLILIYPEWHLPSATHYFLYELLLLLPGLAYAGLFWSAWRNRATWGRHVIFSFGFFVLMLFPILGLVKIAYLRLTLVADHFEYTPMVSVIALCVAGCIYHRRSLRPAIARVFDASAVCIVILFCLLTWQRADVFQDKEKLWLDTLAKNPESWQAHSHYGAILYKKHDLQGALKHWQRCVELKPYIYEVHNNYGLALMATGHMKEALEQYKAAVDIDKTQPPVVLNYADGLRMAKQYPAALEQYYNLLKLTPGDPRIYLDIGVAYFEMGRLDDSISAFEQAIRIAPQWPDPRRNLEHALQVKQMELQKKREDTEKQMEKETGTLPSPEVQSGVQAPRPTATPKKR